MDDEYIVMSCRKHDELVAALQGIFPYAVTGASMSDVNTYEQPQFVRARAAIREHEKDVMRSRGEL